MPFVTCAIISPILSESLGGLGEFRLSQITHWTFALYLFVIAYASMFFLQAALLFPNDIEGYDGYGDYFIARRALSFGSIDTNSITGKPMPTHMSWR